MAEKYYSILTNRGRALEAAASVSGVAVVLKDFVIGDGNGVAVTPDPARTSLFREVYRSAISSLEVSPDQENQFIAHLVIPANVGGFTVREVGLLTDAGELYAVSNSAAIEKPESGINVNLQFRLAVSETANIELKVATGDGLFLRQDANLSDVKDKDSSRKNLGLGSAAQQNSDVFLAVESNLSDVKDKAESRKNLGLKSAALLDAQASKNDVTPGKVLTNGSAIALRSVRAISSGGDVTDANNLPGNSVSFVYETATNSPDNTGSVLSFSGLDGGYDVQLMANYGSGTVFKFRTHNGDERKWNSWNEIYHSGHKPTAADTGAVPVTGGNVDYLDGAKYYAVKSEGWQGAGSWAQQLSDPTAPFFKHASVAPNITSTYHPIIKGTVQTEGLGYVAAASFGLLTKGGANFPDACIHTINDGGQSYVWSFGSDGALRSPGTVFAGDAAFGTNGDVLGTVWGGWLSTWLGANTATQTYVNQRIGDLQTWSTQNFVSSVQLGAVISTWWPAAGGDAPAGYVLTGGDFNEDQSYVRYKPVQFWTRGGWVNAQG